MTEFTFDAAIGTAAVLGGVATWFRLGYGWAIALPVGVVVFGVSFALISYWFTDLD